MTRQQYQDNERLAFGLAAALLLHAAIFLIAFFIPAFKIPPEPEYEGPVVIELDSFTDSVNSQTEPDNFVTDRPLPSAARAPTIPGPEPVPGRPSADVRPTTTEPREETSRLAEGSLRNLDEALQRANTPGNGLDGSGTGRDASGSDTGTSSTWADNTSREPVSRTEPVIPRWVSEQGLRLKVELSVDLTADGFIQVKGIKTSSGYSDVDAAVRNAVSRWKYTRLSQAKSLSGIITYIIQPM